MPPVRPNLSIGDTLAAMNATIGILLALVRRGWSPASSSPAGQDVDVSIAESVFGLLESCVPEFDRLGVVREPSGSSLTGIVPTGTYPCRDGAIVDHWGERGLPVQAPDAGDGASRPGRGPALCGQRGPRGSPAGTGRPVAEWTSGLAAAEAQARCDAAAVPCGPIYSVRDLVQDAHFQARGCFEEVATRDGRPLKVPATVHPKLTATPGATLRGGPRLGEHTDEVLGSLLALPPGEIAALRSRGVIA
ncbi:unnamed protein product [Prorocentrum cordatum]|uniref:Formyl-CoA transferase n=1 Tax=Prorocentrum cordatum TaxID=2364126 RepID=A0ABN9VUE2_9DINO|nr:unnamed protein product [Polarella glacialis]